MNKKYRFAVYGRPKNEAIDSVMERVNKTMGEMGYEAKIGLSAPLQEMSLEIPDTSETKEKVKEFIETATKLYSEKFSDVFIKEI